MERVVKAALIPPIKHLDEFGSGPFHLLLTHLLDKPTYKRHYKAQRKSGAYLVLDNSAHEHGAGQDPVSLLKAGFELDAQEIVVPDVLDNAEKTIEACLAAHEEWFEGGSREILDAYSPAFMYVPQGKDESDWLICLNCLVQIHQYCARKYSLRRDFVIGVSKDYDAWDGGVLKLLEEHVVPIRETLAQSGIKMSVHMLGWMRNLRNLQVIAAKHKWIRSTDSAKPFVYALAGVDLLESLDTEYPTRPHYYFSSTFTPRQKKYARNNSWLFQEAAEGTDMRTLAR
jgi:hypothetical protein